MRLASKILFSVIVFFASVAFVAQAPTVSAQSSGGSWDTEWESDWQGQETEQINTWRRYSSEIQQAIDALPDEPVQNLIIPVLGIEASDITPNFGDPRDGGTRTHEGLDILAPRNTPIISPTEAVVLRTGQGINSGTYVYTANPGGETFVYMHLESIAEGVAAGTVLVAEQVLGYVGNTGNASDGPTHLHFEIRKDGPTDPYPRLTQTLPAPASAAAARTSAENLPTGDLTIDSTGADVVELQKFLIAHSVGPAAERLARAGATGYFGTITGAALAEYQAAADITPAVGYYGPTTRAFIAADTEVQKTVADVQVDPSMFTRDLELGTVGEDVRALQQYLNENGFPVAATGAGSVGSETTYFGPLTRAALALFQKAHSIAPAAGYFGPITRAFVKAS